MLRQLFSDEELLRLTPLMDASTPTNLGYYPLPRRGERFPICDPHKEPVMSPRPDSDAAFLQGAPLAKEKEVSEPVLLSCSNSPSWPSLSRCRVSVVTLNVEERGQSARLVCADTRVAAHSLSNLHASATPLQMSERLMAQWSEAGVRAGLLEGMAAIERQAYDAMAERGASPVQRVMTAGGGAKNPVWTRLREQALGVSVTASPNGALSCYYGVVAAYFVGQGKNEIVFLRPAWSVSCSSPQSVGRRFISCRVLQMRALERRGSLNWASASEGPSRGQLTAPCSSWRCHACVIT